MHLRELDQDTLLNKDVRTMSDKDLELSLTHIRKIVEIADTNKKLSENVGGYNEIIAN
jgi:hypothetical protein